ncbi:hypothetical protein AALA90_11420 [Lachnospiraceae bacterium 38-10]
MWKKRRVKNRNKARLRLIFLPGTARGACGSLTASQIFDIFKEKEAEEKKDGL